MQTFDRDDVRLRLEGLKLSHTTLQQCMTLSASGLALFFSFVSKAQFVSEMKPAGTIVVTCWVLSLCCAIIAHSFHVGLFLMIRSLSDYVHETDELSAEVQKITSLPDLEAFRERTRQSREMSKAVHNSFLRQFFPLQTLNATLTAASLFTLVVGFILLAIAYGQWELGIK